MTTPKFSCTVNWKEEMKLPNFNDLEKGKRTDNGAILLTGATGFLGPLILFNLLELYPDRKIYCLVRGESEAHAISRLEKDIKLTSLDFNSTTNMKVLCGTLELDNFGLSEKDYSQLVSEVSEIYHNGASVKMTFPYSQLKGPNVVGTIQGIKLAIQTGSKIHYVSSIAAIPARALTQEEMFVIEDSDMENKGGYGQTKIVSEQLLNQAQLQYGIETNLFRPSVVSGHSVNGYSNLTDFTNLIILTILTLKAVPDKVEYHLNWIPVDFVAKSIVELSNKPKNSFIFHLIGTGGPTLKHVINIIAKEGYHLETVTQGVWEKKLESLPETHPAFPVKHVLKTLVNTPSILTRKRTTEELGKIGLQFPTDRKSVV